MMPMTEHAVDHGEIGRWPARILALEILALEIAGASAPPPSRH
jgi:hypothetical protein